MKVSLPPPREEIPENETWWRDFTFLLATQLRISWHTARHWSVWAWLLTILAGVGLVGVFVGLGALVGGSLRDVPASLAGGLLGLIFLMGLAMQLFTGLTTAFSTLYLSPDLPILFMTPVSTRAVFAMKSLLVALANFLFVLLLGIVPAVIYGLAFSLGPGYYLVVALVVLGLWALGTALSELFNLAAMRLCPPHRAREAMGVIGALGGLLLAALFQIPSLLMDDNENVNLAAWLTGQQEALAFMEYTPMGWAACALTAAADSSWGPALGWALLLVAASVILYLLAGLLLERGFRQGWLAVAQATGGPTRRRSTYLPAAPQAPAVPVLGGGLLAPRTARENLPVWPAVRAIARKDLLSFRRDMREWMNIITPLVVLVFITINLVNSSEAARASLLGIIVTYGVMMGGQMALQSFGREGEAPWVLNSVPTTGWPVVWGKLLAAVLPSLLVMETMLLLTALPLGLPVDLIVGLALAVVFLTLGASSISLYGSLNYARFNPDSPQQRISGSGSMLMFLVNLVFTAVLGYGVAVALLPGEYLGFLDLWGPPFPGGAQGFFVRLLYYLSRPFTWDLTARRAFGLPFALLTWALVFFGFLALTAKQAARGIEVAAVTAAVKPRRRA